MRLINIYDYEKKVRLDTLWGLLEERPDYANISHSKMPTREQHEKFVEGKPYAVWYFITPDNNTDRIYGAVYLDSNKEIGIAVSRGQRDSGVGTEALEELFKIHRGPFYANIAPENDVSMAFFKKMGFELIQYTYKLEIDDADRR